MEFDSILWSFFLLDIWERVFVFLFERVLCKFCIVCKKWCLLFVNFSFCDFCVGLYLKEFMIFVLNGNKVVVFYDRVENKWLVIDVLIFWVVFFVIGVKNYKIEVVEGSLLVVWLVFKNEKVKVVVICNFIVKMWRYFFFMVIYMVICMVVYMVVDSKMSVF